MSDIEFELLISKAKCLQVLAQECLDEATSFEAEVRIRFSALMNERNELRWRADPYSENADSLADLDF